MRLVLLRCQRTPHLQHVHIVVVALAAVGGEVEVLGNDSLHRLPTAVDVAGGAPREGGTVNPRAGISPATGIHAHISTTRILDGLGNGRIAFPLVEHQVVLVMIIGTTTEVHLDEVETAVFEEEIGILLVVTIEAHALTRDVAVEHRTASISSGIAVDASLQSLLMDIVGHGFQSVGETGSMDEQMTVILIATTEISVVDVDMVEAHVFQPFADHRIGLPFDNTLTDVHAESVPRTPAHRGTVLSYCRHCGQQCDDGLCNP